MSLTGQCVSKFLKFSYAINMSISQLHRIAYVGIFTHGNKELEELFHNISQFAN